MRPGPEERERVLRAIQPNMALHLIDNAGHWAMYEAAREVNALLRGVVAHAGHRGKNG